MKTYLLNVIDRVKKYSKKLDNLSILTGKAWMFYDTETKKETLYYFKKNKELYISVDSVLTIGSWELLDQDYLVINNSSGKRMYEHGFLDNKILALKVGRNNDGEIEYALLINKKEINENNDIYSVVNNHLNSYIQPDMPPLPVGAIKENYPSININIKHQIWMNKNLDVECFQNGDEIKKAKTSAEWIDALKNKEPAWCIYNNNLSWGNKHGKVYNWYAVSDTRGLAPKGFRIPTDEDWKILKKYCNDSCYPLCDDTDWGMNRKNKIRNNSTLFSALPSGIVNNFGKSYSTNNETCWWSRTDKDKDNAWVYSIVDGSSMFIRRIEKKTFGLSVRCIKNSN